MIEVTHFSQECVHFTSNTDGKHQLLVLCCCVRVASFILEARLPPAEYGMCYFTFLFHHACPNSYSTNVESIHNRQSCQGLKKKRKLNNKEKILNLFQQQNILLFVPAWSVLKFYMIHWHPFLWHLSMMWPRLRFPFVPTGHTATHFTTIFHYIHQRMQHDEVHNRMKSEILTKLLRIPSKNLRWAGWVKIY